MTGNQFPITGEVLIFAALGFLIGQGFVFLHRTMDSMRSRKREEKWFAPIAPGIQPTPEHEVVAVADWSHASIPEQPKPPELPMLDLNHKRKFHFGGK